MDFQGHMNIDGKEYSISIVEDKIFDREIRVSKCPFCSKKTDLLAGLFVSQVNVAHTEEVIDKSDKIYQLINKVLRKWGLVKKVAFCINCMHDFSRQADNKLDKIKMKKYSIIKKGMKKNRNF